ncbi:hypothetical protein L7F22_061302 [Adiantum nelumboides]|nr:hypothetical protein [Adiantum nelumboides]
MKEAGQAITRSALDFKNLLNSAPQYTCNFLTLLKTLTILEDGFPSNLPVTSTLHACRKLGNQQASLCLHAYILRTGMETHLPLENRLVSLLVETGYTVSAQKFYERLAYRSASSWNALISGYLKCGLPHSALALYQSMLRDCAQPSIVNFVGLLKACAQLQDLNNGTLLHSHVAQLGLLDKDLFVSSVLVDMYAKCGSMA